MYYLRAKSLPSAILSIHNINIIPVTYSPAGLASKEGHEVRPAGTTLPCLRIKKPGQEPFFICESMAIMEYFEELFGCKAYPDLRGSTLEQRSRTSDILSLLQEAIVWYGVACLHGDPSTLLWSGMKTPQSSSASADAKMRHHKLLSKLEKWVGDGITIEGWRSLSGDTEVTLADLVLMATVEFAEHWYAGEWRDWIAEHGVLRVWCERAKEQPWFVTKEELEEMDMARIIEGVFAR
jgi:glutathione S-transferase